LIEFDLEQLELELQGFEVVTASGQQDATGQYPPLSLRDLPAAWPENAVSRVKKWLSRSIYRFTQAAF
jgi:hypothetical protein